MNISILGQGISSSLEYSVGTLLIKYLQDEHYHSFTAISAFASEAAINGLSKNIEDAKKRFKNLSILVGVDQKGTSKEALYSLLNLGVASYIFYQTGYSIFHPKIYFFEGNNISQLIIGSSNLTSNGLFINVEASVHLELFHENKEDLSVIEELKSQFKGFFDFSDSNIKKISTELIEELIQQKIVPTEAERKEAQDKIEPVNRDDSYNKENLFSYFPKRILPVLPKEFRIRKKEISEQVIGKTVLIESEVSRLVWKRRKLPPSSVEIANSSATNPTGGLRLVQDKFEIMGNVIDQTTYFRYQVFGQLDWVIEKQNPLVEIAIGKFDIVINKQKLGIFPLKIRHKPSGEAGQHNYTTLISWGELSKTIKEQKLTNKELRLYILEDFEDVFRIEIS